MSGSLRALQRRWPWVIAILAATACVQQSMLFTWKGDDAFITFAYAQNWVAGHGVVFNVGERVEGYTCFLWVAISALGLFLGADVFRWCVRLATIGAVGAAVASWQLARTLLPEHLRHWAVLAALLVSFYPPMAWWAGSGMETTLFACLVTVALCLHVRAGADSIAAPICLALASMTRPEAWLLAGLATLDAFRLGPPRRAVRYAAIFFGCFGPYYLWRFGYYGAALPNTFYAKVGSSGSQITRGLLYLLSFVIGGGGWYLLLGAPLAFALRTARRPPLVYVFLIAYVAYIVSVGGDFLQSFRFFLPIVPTLVALFSVALVGWTDRLLGNRRGVIAVLRGAVVLGLLYSYRPMFFSQESLLRPFDDIWKIETLTCRRIQKETAADDAIAAVGVGILKFCSGRRVIDMVGLTDAHIAHRSSAGIGSGLAGHEKFDSEYVLAQRPKFIVIPRPDTFQGIPLGALIDMWQQPQLRQHYTPDPVGYRRIDPW